MEREKEREEERERKPPRGEEGSEAHSVRDGAGFRVRAL